MTPNTLKKTNQTKTIYIHGKPKLSLGSTDHGNFPECSGTNLELLSQVSKLLEKDFSDKDQTKSRWDDVIRLLCGKLETVKGELNTVKKYNKALCQQKMVCIFMKMLKVQ